MSIQEILFRIYQNSKGERLLMVVERQKAQTGQVRAFATDGAPEEFLIIREHGNMLVIVPITTYLQLAITDKYPPLIKWKGFRYVPLPFWSYASRRVVENFSVPLFDIPAEGLEKIREYVKTARTKGIGHWRERFIEEAAKRYSEITTQALAEYAEEQE